MIHVVAHIGTKPGKRESVLREFASIVPVVRAEKGCIEYVPIIDAAGAGALATPLGPDAFAVVEKWETMEDLRAHAAAPHMAAYGAKVRDSIASRAIHVLTAA